MRLVNRLKRALTTGSDSVDGKWHCVVCDATFTTACAACPECGRHSVVELGSGDAPFARGASNPPLDEAAAAELLGVSTDASDPVVRQAFREIVKDEHPDWNGDGDGDADSVQQLKRARERLLE